MTPDNSRESSEREEMPCPDCGGEGYLPERGCECEWCAGTGRIYVPLPRDAHIAESSHQSSSP